MVWQAAKQRGEGRSVFAASPALPRSATPSRLSHSGGRGKRLPQTGGSTLTFAPLLVQREHMSRAVRVRSAAVPHAWRIWIAVTVRAAPQSRSRDRLRQPGPDPGPACCFRRRLQGRRVPGRARDDGKRAFTRTRGGAPRRRQRTWRAGQLSAQFLGRFDPSLSPEQEGRAAKQRGEGRCLSEDNRPSPAQLR